MFQKLNKTLKLVILLLAVNSVINQSFNTFTSVKDITPDVVMKWKFDGDDVVLYFEKKTLGHLWVGLGKTMADADVWKIAKTAGGTDLTIEDCFMNGYMVPVCTETSNITIEHKEATATSLKVQFRRKKVTGDTANDRDITNLVNNIIYSYTDADIPAKHTSKYGFTAVDFSMGDGGAITIKRSKWGDGTFMAHQHGLIIIWTVVCDILILIGKYLKKFKWWFDIHGWIFVALGITSGILTSQAPDFKPRILEWRDLAEGEVNYIESWAKKDLHKRTGGITNVITYIMIIQGILMRFVIALDNRKFFHWVKGYDLTLSRQIHTILGIVVWIISKVALLTGAAIHSRFFGSTLYYLIVGELILAFILFVLCEVIYRVKRKNWKYPLALTPTKKGDYTKILERIRSKGNYYFFKIQFIIIYFF